MMTRTIKHNVNDYNFRQEKIWSTFYYNKVIQSAFKYGLIKLDASSIMIIITMTCVHKFCVVKGQYVRLCTKQQQILNKRKLFLSFSQKFSEGKGYKC